MGPSIGTYTNGVEAQKAGAVAIQSYALWFIHDNSPGDPAEICDDTRCQVFNVNEAIVPGAQEAVEAIGSSCITNSNGVVIKAEYADETNNGGCGDGKFANPVSGSCNSCGAGSGDVCTGQVISGGHNRGMCQWGSFRWATGLKFPNKGTYPNDGGGTHNKGVKDWKEILNYYYCDYIKVIATGEAPIPSFVCRGCETDLDPICQSLRVSYTATSIRVDELAIENLGANDATNFEVDFYLSTNQTINNAYNVGSAFINHIPGNEVFYLPEITFSTSSIPPGNYYVHVAVDQSNTVEDVDLTNNYCLGYGPIVIGGNPTCNDGIQNQGELDIDCGPPCPPCSTSANLVSQTCGIPIVNNNTLDILYDVTNYGSVASGSFNVSFFASKKGQSTYTNLNIDTRHTSISGSTVENFKKSIELSDVFPSLGLDDAEYRIRIHVDYNDEVNESNENDNFCQNSIYFPYETNNLTFSSHCLSTEVYQESINVYFEIVNEGNDDTGLFNYRCFVVDNQTGVPYPIGNSYGIINVAGNSIYQNAISFHIEDEMSVHGLSPGSYSIGIYIDNTDVIDESSEVDNDCISANSFNYLGGCNSQNGFLNGTWSDTYSFRAPTYLSAPSYNEQSIVTAPNGDLSLQAGGFIDLYPGFVAEYGSHFSATIGDCSDVMNKILADAPENELLSIENTKAILTDNRTAPELVLAANEKAETQLESDLFSMDLAVSPNPFSDMTNISYSLQASDKISLVLLDIEGKIVNVLEDNIVKSSGTHILELDRKNLSIGTYVLRLTSSNQSVTQKLFIVD